MLRVYDKCAVYTIVYNRKHGGLGLPSGSGQPCSFCMSIPPPLSVSPHNPTHPHLVPTRSPSPPLHLPSFSPLSLSHTHTHMCTQKMCINTGPAPEAHAGTARPSTTRCTGTRTRTCAHTHKHTHSRTGPAPEAHAGTARLQRRPARARAHAHARTHTHSHTGLALEAHAGMARPSTMRCTGTSGCVSSLCAGALRCMRGAHGRMCGRGWLLGVLGLLPQDGERLRSCSSCSHTQHAPALLRQRPTSRLPLHPMRAQTRRVCSSSTRLPSRGCVGCTSWASPTM